MTDAINVQNDAEHGRFVAVVDGLESELTYRLDGDRLILDHTGVPRQLEGRGIAGQLMQAVVDQAAESGQTLVPLCSYTSAWLRKHPDEAERVSIDW